MKTRGLIIRLTVGLTVAAIGTLSTACTHTEKSSPAETPSVQVQAPAVASNAIPSAGVREDAIVKQYSLEELNAAAGYLLTVFEASLDGKKAKILACDPSPETAQMWLSGPMHAMIDAKSAVEKDSFGANTDQGLAKVEKKWNACAATCQCGAYLGITELIDPKTPKLEKMIKNLERANKKQSPKQTAACGKKATWFCKSDLLTYLKSNRDS